MCQIVLLFMGIFVIINPLIYLFINKRLYFYYSNTGTHLVVNIACVFCHCARTSSRCFFRNAPGSPGLVFTNGLIALNY